MSRGRVVCISHGFGPHVLSTKGNSKNLADTMRKRVREFLRLGHPDQPRAIVVVTSGSEYRHPIISGAPKHSLIYNYRDWPSELYKLEYDAPGAPDVAFDIGQALIGEGFLDLEMDLDEAWDYGVFVPMTLINPSADVPIVQMFILSSHRPREHFRMGRALSKLRDSNVAIVGSGSPTASMDLPPFQALEDFSCNGTYDDWNKAVNEAVSQPTSELRLFSLQRWRTFPGSFEMHPKKSAEDFMPLIVCAGAAGDDAVEIHSDKYHGLDAHSYYWK